MLVIFIVDNDFEHLYFTTSDNYSEVLNELMVEPERVKFKTIPMESISLMLDGQLDYIMR